jgi:hypothetical protein
MQATFTIRKKLLSKRYYVFVRLPDGTSRKVARFSSISDAESWVEFRAQGWLARHQQELGLTSAPAPA